MLAVEPTTVGVNEFWNRPCLDKHSVGRRQVRWSDDLRRTSWMRVAEDRARWREVGEAYAVDCSGLMMTMMAKANNAPVAVVNRPFAPRLNLSG
jgi:hypothetical protein